MNTLEDFLYFLKCYQEVGLWALLVVILLVLFLIPGEKKGKVKKNKRIK